jgi:hypothetical protein
MYASEENTLAQIDSGEFFPWRLNQTVSAQTTSSASRTSSISTSQTQTTSRTTQSSSSGATPQSPSRQRKQQSITPRKKQKKQTHLEFSQQQERELCQIKSKFPFAAFTDIFQTDEYKDLSLASLNKSQKALQDKFSSLVEQHHQGQIQDEQMKNCLGEYQTKVDQENNKVLYSTQNYSRQ